MNNSIHLNLLRFKLLSRESEMEHPVIESIFSYLEVYTSSVV